MRELPLEDRGLRKGRPPHWNPLTVTAVLITAFFILATLPRGDGLARRRTAFAVTPESVLPFSPNIRVSGTTTAFLHQVEPTLVVDESGRLYVGWKEAETADGPGRRVSFARSLDGGFTWSTPSLMALRDASRSASDPWLALDEAGRLHYARLEYASDLTFGGLAVSTSDDGGGTWGPLMDPDDSAGFADKESIASDGNGTMYLAYDDLPNPAGDLADLRFTRSTDGGRTWSPTVSVAERRGTILGPVIAARPDGTVHVAWWNLTDGNVMADVSRDRGVTWGADVRVNNVWGSAPVIANSWESSMPSVVVNESGSVFVAWADRGAGNSDILVARSDDGGATWSAPAQVNDDSSSLDQWMPALALDGRGALHAAWMDRRTGNLNVYYANSTDSGRTWSTNVRVTTAETSSSFVRPGDYLFLAADRNGTAYVVWTDGRDGNLDIYFARNPYLGPQVTISANPRSGEVPFAVSFNAVATGGMLPYVYTWDFGDGDKSVSPNPSHTFRSAGNWTVTLAVTDAVGASATARVYVVATASILPWVLIAGGTVTVLAAGFVLLWRRRRTSSRRK